MYGCSLFLFIAISLIVWIFTNRITRPIRILTDKTEQLKKAVDTDSKNHVVDSLEKEDIFKSVSQDASSKYAEIDEIEELKKLFCEFVMFKDDVKNFKYWAPRYYEKASHRSSELKLSYQPPEITTSQQELDDELLKDQSHCHDDSTINDENS